MRLPNDTERQAIIGRTGSGKTQAGIWQLSVRSYDAMPWIIFNTKGDSLINQLPAIQTTIYKPVPDREGLYVVRPMPHEEKALEAYLWAIWEKGNIGIYIDEGYLMGTNNPAFRALLTQGRSKYIPMIILSQRPVYMDRFVWSECEYFQIFSLSNGRDRIVMEKEVLHGRNIDWGLVHKFHSLYYDGSSDKLSLLKPVPSRAEILATFRIRVPQYGHKWI